MDKYVKPFSSGFVLKLTMKHMLAAVEVSVRKTFERVSEFSGDPEKSKEIFFTLTALQTMKKVLDDFRRNNQQLFEGNKE